jgi:hypothetical protein
MQFYIPSLLKLEFFSIVTTFISNLIGQSYSLAALSNMMFVKDFSQRGIHKDGIEMTITKLRFNEVIFNAGQNIPSFTLNATVLKTGSISDSKTLVLS